MLDTNVIKTIRVPKPIKPLDTNLFDYCPRCGVNSVRPATINLNQFHQHTYNQLFTDLSVPRVEYFIPARTRE